MILEKLEQYLLLLSDSFFSNLAIDTQTETAIHTMQVFGNYNSLAMIAFAITGFFGAILVNYFFGTVLYKIFAPSNEERLKESNGRIEKLKSSKLLPFILLFSAQPIFGKFVLSFAGFCRIRFLYMLSICILAKLSYFVYLMMM